MALPPIQPHLSHHEVMQHAANAFRPLYAAPVNPPTTYASGPSVLVSPPLQPMPIKRAASQTPLADETPAKKTTKWTQEEDELTVELRGAGMKWEDISKRIPGRSAISCRLRYQNYLEKRAHWDEEKKNKLARLYVRYGPFLLLLLLFSFLVLKKQQQQQQPFSPHIHIHFLRGCPTRTLPRCHNNVYTNIESRFKEQMWQKVASEMGVPWRSAEAMHWTLGPEEIASRANQPVFQLSASATVSQAGSVTPQQSLPQVQQFGSAFTPTNATVSPTYTASSQGPTLAPLTVAVPQPPQGHVLKRSRTDRDAASLRRRADSARSSNASGQPLTATTGTSPGAASLHQASASDGSIPQSSRPVSGEYISPFPRPVEDGGNRHLHRDERYQHELRRPSNPSSGHGSTSPQSNILTLPTVSGNLSGDEAGSVGSDRRSVRSLSGSTARESGRERDDGKEE